MLEINNLVAEYGKRVILNNISASFKKGELTCILGVNGCGKTTLLKSVLGILNGTKGEILIDKTPISVMSRREIARKIAYLPQGRNTPDMIVSKLVLHGRFPHLKYPKRYTKSDLEIASNALKRVGMEEYSENRLYTLSGGMKQNVYVAMALAQDTDYILLDEPTTYLDVSNQIQVMKLLKSLANSGKGIVAVMHDISLALTFAGNCVIVDNGRIIAQATPEEIFNSKVLEKSLGICIKKSSEGDYYINY